MSLLLLLLCFLECCSSSQEGSNQNVDDWKHSLDLLYTIFYPSPPYCEAASTKLHQDNKYNFHPPKTTSTNKNPLLFLTKSTMSLSSAKNQQLNYSLFPTFLLKDTQVPKSKHALQCSLNNKYNCFFLPLKIRIKKQQFLP